MKTFKILPSLIQGYNGPHFVKLLMCIPLEVYLFYCMGLFNPKTERRNHVIKKKSLCHIGFDMTKPVFGVSNKARLKPVSSASEASYKIEISPVASLDMILSQS